eukprot:IDg13453t1
MQLPTMSMTAHEGQVPRLKLQNSKNRQVGAEQHNIDCSAVEKSLGKRSYSILRSFVTEKLESYEL